MSLTPTQRQNRIELFALWLLSLLPLAAYAQPENTVVRPDFSRALVVPQLLRDSAHVLTFDTVRSEAIAAQFVPAKSPYLTFGADASTWWLYFTVKNELPNHKTLILWLNRKNFDAFSLLQQKPDSTFQFYGDVGASFYDDSRFALSNGYYIAVLMQPGENKFWAKASNEVGSMYLGLSLHTPDHFALKSRQNVLLFGLFLGTMLVSIFFALQLYFMYRDPMYLFYLAYVAVVLLREAYNHSAVINLFPVMQRHGISFLMVATYGLFYRYFIRLWEVDEWLDKVTKYYLWGMFALTGIFGILVKYEHGPLMQVIFTAAMLSILVITIISVIVIIRNFRTNIRARIVVFAFMPLALAFILNLLRNINALPNYPFIQYAVMWGFILEALIFAIAFIRWHRNLHTDRDVLQLKLSMEQQEKLLAVQAAEQKVKDRIARDLHDDIAASMSGIRILSKVAHQQFAGKVPEAAPLLEQISKSAQSTLESISDLIWAVKPHPDYLNDIADRMREYAQKFLDANDIDYQLNIPRNLPVMELDIESRRNVYLIFKEAINNAMKHSQCTQMDISLLADAEKMTLLIADNGIGFDPEQTLEQGAGVGLGSMHKRARDIGGELKISSRPGQGTRVAFVLPVKRD
ncbi:MAG: 7TM diverse intracellular signaling domain-containing protein [Saprospiraceae bacterium]|nr:7TM diverse intracellular signaling domain-containing protein [Saprospiraceae bacterium]